MFKQILILLVAINVTFSFTLIVSASSIAKKHDVVVNTSEDPNFDLTIDGKHIRGSFYDKTLKRDDYPKELRDFDGKLMESVADLGVNFANDIVIKNTYTAILGPKYIAKVTGLISSSKKSDKSGPVIKDSFVGDAVLVWKAISKDVLGNPEMKAKITESIPKNGEEFMNRFSDFMGIMQEIVKNNPMGNYIDWRGVTIDDKLFAEYVAPFVAYLQEKGYRKHISIMDMLMGIVGKMNPASE